MSNFHQQFHDNPLEYELKEREELISIVPNQANDRDEWIITTWRESYEEVETTLADDLEEADNNE